MLKYTTRDLQDLTSKWGAARLITVNGNIPTQTIKFGEEMSELFEAESIDDVKDSIGDMVVVASMIADLKGNSTALECMLHCEEEFQAATNKDLLIIWFGKLCKTTVRGDLTQIDLIVGGLLKILDNICNEYNLSFNECWNLAYNEIKDRKGKLLENGNFIKESDIKDEN
ncbi:hypothetical protein [Sulfurimonas sp.]|uniref:hypothetical protein n=1 Tax=Sulfurimonas sp. TaxID=2022749 RepID=UPI003563911F